MIFSFLGWYISEGWSYKHNCLGLSQSLKANPANTQEIMRLLEKMKIPYKFNGTSFLLNMPKEVAEYCRNLGTAEKKYIPREILNLDKKTLNFSFRFSY